jgi:hypothetical protein
MRIQFDKLKTLKGFLSLVEVGTKINMDSEYVLYPFYRVKGIMLPYYTMPTYSEYSGNHAHKYTIVDINGDIVLILFKRISIMTTKYCRLIGTPISLNGNYYNELEVLKVLKNNELVNQVWLTDYDEAKLMEADIVRDGMQPVDYDYFTLVKKRLEYVSRGKWRSKRGVNKAINGGIYMSKAKTEDLDKMLELDERWINFKENVAKHNVEGKKRFKNIINALRKNIDDEHIYAYNLWFKDVLIGTIIFLSTHRSNVVIQVVNKSLDRARNEDILDRLGEDRGYVEDMLKHIGGLLTYFSIMELDNIDVDVSYCAGGRDDKILEYKKIMNDGNIRYFKSEKFGL